jgi:serine/threonine-protein kinase HipA
MTEAEVAEAVLTLRQHPLGVDDDVRVSLGGLQSKLLLVQTPAGWARPVGGIASTHILKPDPPEYPGLVASEAFALRAAALAGIPAAEARLDAFGPRTVLVVKRFDRIAAGGAVIRVHQEDGCQLLAIDPSGPDKYQGVDGAASYLRLAAVLAEYAQDASAELHKLAAILTFTIAAGNTDAHLRNHAFLHGDNTISLAPVFDAAPTRRVAGTRQLALWVAGVSLLDIVTRDHLVREISGWGLDRDAACSVVDTTLLGLEGSFAEAAREVGDVAPDIIKDCQDRTARLLCQRQALSVAAT